eukprot:Skav206624  [mRNA]  locus=scaffold2321:34054:34671:- [translate_table: standard]
MVAPSLLLTSLCACFSTGLSLQSGRVAHGAAHGVAQEGPLLDWLRRHTIHIPPDVPTGVSGNAILGQCNWGGMNSYFVHALKEEDQLNTLAAMQRWGLKVLRIFISPVPANFKGSSSQFVSALEPDRMGAYEPQVLDLINSFMVKAQQYGVKLVIAMHDRYSLGCWACDGYQKELNLTCAPAKHKKCGPGVYLACICRPLRRVVP